MVGFYLPQNYLFNAIFLLIQNIMLQIAAHNGRNALRTGADLVQTVLRQLRGHETRDRSFSDRDRSSGIDIPSRNQLRNEIPGSCGQARRTTSQIAGSQGTDRIKGVDSPSSRTPFVKGWRVLKRSVRSMHAEFLQQDRRGSRFISGRSISSAPVFSRNYYVTERRARGDKDAEETAGGSVGRLGDRNKKGACLFLYLCAVAETGVFPHARDRTCTAIWTKSPNPISWTDRRTDGQTNEPARANRGPFAVPTTSICCTRTGCGFNNASPWLRAEERVRRILSVGAFEFALNHART